MYTCGFSGLNGATPPDRKGDPSSGVAQAVIAITDTAATTIAFIRSSPAERCADFASEGYAGRRGGAMPRVCDASRRSRLPAYPGVRRGRLIVNQVNSM